MTPWTPEAMERLSYYADGLNMSAVCGEIIRAALDEIDRLTAQAEAMRLALEKIERWFGEFPGTDRFYTDEAGQQREHSYAYCYGSNGERDFMRSVARHALESQSK